jgi:hypothetical protein
MALDVEQELCDALNWELCLELFRESYPAVTETEILRVFSIAKKNAVDAVVLYKMMELTTD